MRSLDELLDTTLPLNRKERYFTGTVLPALLCTDSMSHLHVLGTLLGLDNLEVRADPDDCTVLFFTEYGLSESAIGPARERFAGLPTGRDTPDVVILVTEPVPVLIALEAKMYDRPSRPDLLKQLNGQAQLLEPLRERSCPVHSPPPWVTSASGSSPGKLSRRSLPTWARITSMRCSSPRCGVIRTWSAPPLLTRTMNLPARSWSCGPSPVT